MACHAGWHRFVRAVCSWYPIPFGDDWFNRRLDHFFASDEPNWLVAAGRGRWPTMVFNVADNLQRKFFYFPRLHWYYRASPLHGYLARTLQPGATFLDIGANVGFFSLLAARLVGARGRVYAFEPDPIPCESLVRSARANAMDHVQVLPVALSDRDDQATLFRARFGTASSLLPEVPGREARYKASLEISLHTLDALVAAGRVDVRAIGAIKIDVEGEEARTVAGMRQSLVAAGHPPIWCEVRGPKGSTRAPDTYAAVQAQLAPLGYRAYAWTNGKRRALGVGDVVKRMDVLFERG